MAGNGFPKSHGLSKSRITAWRQCPKRLWLKVHGNADDLPEDSAMVRARYEAGDEVGRVACQLCPNGILINNNRNLSADLASTKAALKAHPDRPIFEATFQHDGLLVQADVLLPTSGGYRFTEVKSSSSVKLYHLEDCAVQAWVMKHNKIKLASVELAYIDKKFVYGGNNQYHGLLKFERLDHEVEQLQAQVPVWIKGARTTLAGKEPCIEPGEQCTKPHTCQYIDYCMRGVAVPKYPLFVLFKLSANKKAKLAELGIEDARKVPAEYLNATQAMIQKVSKSGKTKFDQAAAQQEMVRLPYPRYYFDFETISHAVPRWKGTSPYSQIPFQWSCHIETAPGKFLHEMFLDVSGNDPSRGCAESLIKTLGKKGPIFVYSDFERGRITELANRFPDLSRDLLAVNERLFDLLPTAMKHYYHPEMMGSWSIKVVLPTIAPDLSYDNLEVSDGYAAQLAYLEINDSATKDDRKKKLTDGLREYCRLDTWAMVRLASFLEGRKVSGRDNAK